MTSRIQLSRADERDVHSQSGEDGVLARIFSALDIELGMAVEFGAWDGVHLSNTALLREQGWSTVLIEGDDSKVQQLRAIAASKTIVIGAMVAPEGASSLDSLLDGVKVEAVDLLSIDIDGDDIHILSSLRRRPKVICIEFNPTIAPPVIYANPRGTAKGSSICAVHDVATRLGYELVYATYCNAFFVERASASAFMSVSPFEAFHALNRPTIVCYYDGEFGISDAAQSQYRHAWSTVPVFAPALPKALLSWPPTLGKVLLAYLYCAIVAPFFYLKALAKEGVRQLRNRSGA